MPLSTLPTLALLCLFGSAHLPLNGFKSSARYVCVCVSSFVCLNRQDHGSPTLSSVTTMTIKVKGKQRIRVIIMQVSSILCPLRPVVFNSFDSVQRSCSLCPLRWSERLHFAVRLLAMGSGPAVITSADIGANRSQVTKLLSRDSRCSHTTL